MCTVYSVCVYAYAWVDSTQRNRIINDFIADGLFIHSKTDVRHKNDELKPEFKLFDAKWADMTVAWRWKKVQSMGLSLLVTLAAWSIFCSISTKRVDTTQHNLLCQQHRALWSQFCNLYFKLFRCKMVKVLCLHTRLPQPSLEIAYSTCHKFKYYISIQQRWWWWWSLPF